MAYPPNSPCPCYSDRKYKKCCRPYHQGMAVKKPVDLVRARYSAYALGLTDFIMATAHPDSPQYNEDHHRWQASLHAYYLQNDFMGLEILSAADDTVTYRAHLLRLRQEHVTYIERARFQQYEGRWLYVDGNIETEGESSPADASSAATGDDEADI